MTPTPPWVSTTPQQCRSVGVGEECKVMLFELGCPSSLARTIVARVGRARAPPTSTTAASAFLGVASPAPPASRPARPATSPRRLKGLAGACCRGASPAWRGCCCWQRGATALRRAPAFSTAGDAPCRPILVVCWAVQLIFAVADCGKPAGVWCVRAWPAAMRSGGGPVRLDDTRVGGLGRHTNSAAWLLAGWVAP